MRIPVSRALFSLAAIALSCHFTSSGARAALVIDITGTSGASTTLWTFSGSSTAAEAGTIRDTLDTTPPNGGDTWEMDGDPVLSSIADTFFSVPAGATVTVGGVQQNITHVFLDDDSPGRDDFGIRVDSALAYASGADSSWTGSIVVPVSIDDLQHGSYTMANVLDPGGYFAAGPGAIEVNIAPEPSSMAMLGLAGFLSGAFRYRRRKRGSAGEPALS